MEKRWQRLRYTPCLPLGKDRTLVTCSKEHIALSRAAASEGMVLLKNENKVLPLAHGERVVLFGKAAADYVPGGGGSGEVTVPYTRSILEGLRIKQQEGKVELFEKLAAFYEKEVQRQYEEGIMPGMTQEAEVPSALLEEAVSFGGTAVITLCRFSGEGWDRKTIPDDEYQIESGWENVYRRSAELFPEGDFYLTPAEEKLVQTVTERFDKVVVVLNVGGVMASEWIRENDRIRGALLAWQGGMEGGLAAADVLVGDVNPSGRLADTFARRLEDYPSTEGFHESIHYVNYTEDIYVGYRYFETIPGAAKKVIYPFGYGLSYSEFLVRPSFCSVAGDDVVLPVKVMNLSEVPGKTVVQVYAKLPSGKLGKPALTLVSFAKTGMLGSGAQQEIDMSFPVRMLASYDDLGKVQKSAWVLEKGTYEFFVGENIRSLTRAPYTWTLEEDRVVEQLTERCAPGKLEKRMLQDGSYEALPQHEYPAYEMGLSPIPDLGKSAPTPSVPAKDHGSFEDVFDPTRGGSRIVLDQVAGGEKTLDDFLAQLTDEEKIHLLGGQPNTGVANTFGFGNLPDYGVPNAMTCDGPAGFRTLPKTGVYATAWPIGTLLACTWDQDLIRRVGAAAALEVKENNCAVWLAPAINIHRNPLCGRNFEYFSEDPVLTGLCAGALVHGVQEQGISVSLKHFCVNNKETNRRGSDSRVSERALREIYLKAFELVVKWEQPWSIMSSYNLLNGRHTSENEELLTGILREEWGFAGAVTTDWWTLGEHYLETKAGNDIKMGTGYPERVQEALEKGLISREEIERSARRVLELILKLA